MKTLSALVPIIIFIIMFLLIGKFSISFKPFKISFPQWVTALGYAFFTIGMIIVIIDTGVREHHKGVMKGIDMSYKAMHDSLDTLIRKQDIDSVKDSVIKEEEGK